MAGIGFDIKGRTRLTFEVPGGEKVDVGLGRFGSAIADWRPFFQEELAPKFFGDIQRNFETEGGFVGGWAALSPEYAAWKSEVAGLDYAEADSILVLSGDMRRSLMWVGGRPGRNGIFRASAREVVMGTSDPKATWHQHGTSRMPKRQVLFLARSSTYGRLMHRWALQQWNNASLPPARDLAISRFT